MKEDWYDGVEAEADRAAEGNVESKINAPNHH